MIQFPIITRLSVNDYELYPGTEEEPGLQAVFQPGLTLVIGANGLGKSTFVSLLFRMLTGNAELKNMGYATMGSGQVDIRSMYNHELRTFVDRVGDAAREATATVEFSLGSTVIHATRRLATLTLVDLVADGVEQEPTEGEFRAAIVDAADLDSFLSWFLVLRYLVFYSDERRSLVWDPTAQRRILPLLFLPPSEIAPIEELTERILKEDSTVRNLAAALKKREKELRTQERALDSLPEAQSELESLREQRAEAEERLEELRDEFVVAEVERSRTRLEALRAADDEQSVGAELERLRLMEVKRAFPTADESAAYMLTHLFAEGQCLVCGHAAEEAAAAMAERLRSRHCVVCDTELDPADAVDQGAADLAGTRQRLEDARYALADALEQRAQADKDYVDCISEMADAQDRISKTTAQVMRIERSLPESDRTVVKLRESLDEIRADNEIARQRVLFAKERLARLVDAQNRLLSRYRDQIKDGFDSHATGFLVEHCSLVWGSNAEQIGQLGRSIPYSVFQVDMTGGARENASRRESASQVSESQREFIDLAFRMALIGVAGEGGIGTLVMDAPEGSLDAVFAPRAAEVLTSFGFGDGQSRVIITSNLVDGQLIPRLAEKAQIRGVEDSRIINLFRIAASTAAIRDHRDEYDAALDRAFRAPGEDR